jgi:hypothetical protein
MPPLVFQHRTAERDVAVGVGRDEVIKEGIESSGDVREA